MPSDAEDAPGGPGPAVEAPAHEAAAGAGAGAGAAPAAGGAGDAGGGAARKRPRNDGAFNLQALIARCNNNLVAAAQYIVKNLGNHRDRDGTVITHHIFGREYDREVPSLCLYDPRVGICAPATTATRYGRLSPAFFRVGGEKDHKNSPVVCLLLGCPAGNRVVSCADALLNQHLERYHPFLAGDNEGMVGRLVTAAVEDCRKAFL